MDGKSIAGSIKTEVARRFFRLQALLQLPVGFGCCDLVKGKLPKDIANLMRESPEAACALLNYCSLLPEVTPPGRK